MKKITSLFLLAFMLVFLPSCLKASEKVPGKFVFYSVRNVKDGWASYLYKNGQFKLIGKKMLSPVFSPDGKTIAMGSKEGIVLVDEEGSWKGVIPTKSLPDHLVWSPDGKKISYVMQTENKDRWLLMGYDFNSNQHFTIHNFGPGSSTMMETFSPDSSKLFFTASSDDKKADGLYIYNLNDSNLQYLKRDGVAAGWFSDGKYVAFDSNTDGDGKAVKSFFGAMFKMNIETGETAKLWDMDFAPFLSPEKLTRDGKYFIFSKPQGKDGQHVVLWPVDNHKKEIVVTECIHLGSGFSQDLHPDWYQGD